MYPGQIRNTVVTDSKPEVPQQAINTQASASRSLSLHFTTRRLEKKKINEDNALWILWDHLHTQKGLQIVSLTFVALAFLQMLWFMVKV